MENRPENTKSQAAEKLKESNVTLQGGKQINICQRNSQYVSLIATLFWLDNNVQFVVIKGWLQLLQQIYLEVLERYTKMSQRTSYILES